MKVQEDFLYQENILDHARNPLHQRRVFLSPAESQAFQKTRSPIILSQQTENFSCGDRGTLFLKIKKDKKESLILQASFLGNGCAISQAAFDLLCAELKNKLVSEVKFWTPAKIYELLGVQVNPNRVDCALLSYEALVKILKNV